MPFGGKHQLTPTQVMAAKLPVLQGETNACSVMSWGFDPYANSRSPFHGSYMAVASSVAKLLAAGAPLDKTYLSFQEYFPKLGGSPERWGLPTAALLGAFAAQLDLGLAAIGGKDSMSGSFEQLDVPPTLVSFAISMADARQLVSGEFKQAGSRVVWLAPQLLPNGLPDKQSMLQVFAQISEMIAQNLVHAAYVPGPGGIAAAVLKMGLGNGLGCRFATGLDKQLLFADNAFGFVVELAAQAPQIGVLLGETTEQALLSLDAEQIALDELLPIYEGKLERVFPLHPLQDTQDADPVPCLYSPASKWSRARSSIAQPRFLLPVSPGTNCEYDTARAIERAGGIAEVFIINNMSPAAVGDSVRRFAAAIGRAQVIMIPGGFSGGDEPDGSGKFITAFFRNPLISDAVAELLQKRDGLMCGICNGFQALIKLGLVPFGEIRDMDVDCPTLSFNTIGRHQSKLARTRIASNSSPWLSRTEVGDVYTVPVSHGEGRFLCNDQLLKQLIMKGQIATQYVGLDGLPSMDCEVNINGSVLAVEGITSPDGRIFGKMGHSERISQHVYRNVPGKYDMQLFASAVDFFRG